MDECKRCSACQNTLPIVEFGKNRAKRDGLQNECRSCRYVSSKKHVAKNRERYNEASRKAMKARRSQDPDGMREQMRAWRAANPDKVRAQRETYIAANYERVRELANIANGKWRKANWNAVRDADHRRRARKAATTVGPVDFESLWDEQRGLCGLCGEPIDRSLAWPDPLSASIDHIVPLAKGGAHAQHNIQWAHLNENLRKGVKLLDQ